MSNIPKASDLWHTQDQALMRLVADGCTTKEIAAQLHVSASTVTKRLGRLMARAGASSRASLVRVAFSEGLLTIETTTD
jgi:DNA-binding NarL/FixJ family response regulator